MTRISYLFLFIALIAFSRVQAQEKNYYYDQTTRYGTFRHSNGGTKLVTTFRDQQDYAGQMAESYREAARAQEERERPAGIITTASIVKMGCSAHLLTY